MDGLKHPVGEQPPNVYWRRRVAVVVGIIVLGVLVWWILGALTSGTEEPGGGTSPDPTVTSSTSPAAADPGRDCTAEDFTVTTGPKDAEFSGDDLPTFTVTVSSIADSPCIVDPTSGSKIVVTSGENTWFDSSTCTDYTVFDAEKFVLEPEATHDLTTSWNRGRDDAGCSADPAEKQEGYYWIVATVQGVSADKIQFRLV